VVVHQLEGRDVARAQPHVCIIKMSSSLSDAAARVKSAWQSLQHPPKGTTGLPVHTLHANLVKLAEALCQASRSFHFVAKPPAKEADVLTCAADLEKAANTYAMGAAEFLGSTSDAVRRLATAPCCQLLQCVVKVFAKAAATDAAGKHDLMASDIGQLEKSVLTLRDIALTGNAAASTALVRNLQLVKDAVGEFRESMEEAAAEAMEEYGAADDEAGGEEGARLFADRALCAPLFQLLESAAALLELGLLALCGACDERCASTLVTCARATSAQVDSWHSIASHTAA
jgi:hypothetical protein